MSLFDSVKEKMDEYGINIYHVEKIPKTKERIFYVEDMVLFINDEVKSIGLAFQATTKPDRAANLTLIVAEIDCEDISIMEGFIFNESSEFLSGEQAYQLVDQSKKKELLQQIQKEQMYEDLLKKVKCYEC
jgi:hypothetical protein